MTLFDDIRKGREQQKKRVVMRTQYTRKPKPSGIAIEIGKFIEFVSGRISKRTKDTAKTEGILKKSIGVIKQDFDAVMERLCEKIPKKKPQYDPLDAAWRKGRG